MLIAAFMELFDATMINVVIPSIQRDLGASNSAIQWVVAGYALAFALGLITGGRLGDILGRKRMFLVGMAGFILASALCGVSQSPEMLIVSRVLQGAMAAVMIPQVLSIIQVSFPSRERVAAFGAFGAVSGLASISGPLVGGLLIWGDLFGLDWRPSFLINVPVGILALATAAVVVHESKAPRALRLDLVGVVIVTTGLLLLVYPLVQSRELGPAWILASVTVSVPTLALFALWERRKTRKDGSPLVVLALFRQRAFVAGLLVVLIFFAGITGVGLIFMLYMQIGLGFSGLRAGLTFTPWAIGAAAGAGLISTRLAPRFGRRVLSAGTLLLAAGMIATILTVRYYGTEIGSWQLLPTLLLAGLGMGMVIPPLFDVILAGVPRSDAGSASGMLTTIQQVGAAFGVALIGAIFFGLLASQATTSVDAVSPQLRSDLEAAGVPAPVQEQVVDCFRDRATQEEPSTVWAGCRFEAQSQPGGVALSPAADQRVQQVVEQAAVEARKQNFSSAIERTLRYVVGISLLAFLLVFLLPKKRMQS